MLQSQIHIYTESTPNPQSMKFVFNVELLPDGMSFDYTQPADGLTKEKNSPLAVALFGFDFVKRVFITSNFVTLTKAEHVLWEDELFGIKQYLKKYFEEKRPVFSLPESAISESDAEESEVIAKIKEVLEQYVKPAVESDGGAISFYSFDEESGQVKVLLQGSCSGCPSSTMTLKAGIEALMTRMVPQVKEVVAEGV
ncbi:NifU family protein [Aquirufa ecclesiirivi]|uniref:NifU family protein n=1 Tax=Aquirufa ecclesiirivi TaxID=2715124 RepID=A0ABT4JF41_9BACT|nr:NifU family protein [Aquirufa ecclesiirivi]MCZ2473097.1 NifU family protein [Aquirufa ecclesiirivi]MCZ2474886.1 NifU family protein [Aquirufa ecclesiirivi]MDF0692734.1 NifU family protein [Aquirufa ecclesiirivi]NHC47913.1 NifU family protein [Aquirufa ecclesiirivi]